MASSTSEGPLEELLAPVVAQSGLELDSVTRSRSDAMPLLRVIVEAPIGADGIDSDTLAEVSRAVSKALDVADPIDGEYLLEVSTPGAERELTKVGHWMRQIDVDGETTIIDYQDMRKARSRVDFGSGE